MKIPLPCKRPFSHSFCFKSISSPPSFIFFLRFFRRQFRAVKRCACLSEKVDQWYSKQPVMEISMILAHMSANTLNGFTDIPTHTYTKRPLLLLLEIFVVNAEMHAEKKLCLNTQSFQVTKLNKMDCLDSFSLAFDIGSFLRT